MRRHLLILGGTSEARLLCERLARLTEIEITLSLAGALGDKSARTFLDRLDGETASRLHLRVGGFGGISGLESYLADHAVDIVIDATHPFAAQMSHHAAIATANISIPLVRLTRKPWERQARDLWLMAADIDEAVRLLPKGARVFLAVGRQSVAPFVLRGDCSFVVRSIVAIDDAGFGPDLVRLEEWPGETTQTEADLFRSHGVTCLVVKNSGNDRSYCKVAAARALSLPVIMVERPILPECREFYNMGDIFRWLKVPTG